MKPNSNVFDLPDKDESPESVAILKGSPAFPNIMGRVSFYPMREGTLVIAQASGLPKTNQNVIPAEAIHPDCYLSPVFGFHIHSGSSCTGTAQNPFANAGSHFNPGECPHPYHSGDMPPLFGNKGYALAAFYTNKFRPKDVIGKTVIIHGNPDDFTTQPSGNAGEMIACGEIVALENYI